jgi:Fe2+ or Zn2+ uptake regulation protein
VRPHLGGSHGFVVEAVDLVVHGICTACSAAGGGSR